MVITSGFMNWNQIDDDFKVPIINSSSSLNFALIETVANYCWSIRPNVNNDETGVNYEEEFLKVNTILTACLSIAIFISCIIYKSNLSSAAVSLSSVIVFILNLIATIVFAPILVTILATFACYRRCVSEILKRRINNDGSSFAGLMEGTDAFWATENHRSRSVINIMAFADFTFIVEASNNGAGEPLGIMRELIEERLLCESTPFPKLLFRRRKSRFGYFYWERPPRVDVQDHVRWMESDHDGTGFLSETLLRDYVSSITNSCLPADHSCGWEILIGQYPMAPQTITGDNPIGRQSIYPVLFRVHHTLGDGMALVGLLLDALADPPSPAPSRISTPSLREHSKTFVESELFLADRPTNLSYKMKKSVSYNFEGISNRTPSSDVSLAYFDIPPSDLVYDRCREIKKSTSYNFEKDHRQMNRPIEKWTSLKQIFKTARTNLIEFIGEVNKIDDCMKESLCHVTVPVNDPRMFSDYLYTDVKCNGDEIIMTNIQIDHRNTKTENGENFIPSNFIGNNYFSVGLKIQTFFKWTMNRWKSIFYHLSILTILPASIINKILTMTCDVNKLHGPKLSGRKTVAWRTEHDKNNNDGLLMNAIRRIRDKTGAHFSDVMFTALSDSLENYFHRFHQIPEHVTAIIPARTGRPDRREKISNRTEIKRKTCEKRNPLIYEKSEIELENRFSVALLKLPIAGNNNNILSKLKRVRENTDAVRKSSDYLVNYWILNVAATVLPAAIIVPMLESNHSTLVISNMPGPQTKAKLAGHLIKDIVFWVPNKDTTGVGVTILSYDGYLELGIMADHALIAYPEDGHLILDGVAEIIKKLDYQLSASL